MLVLMMMMMTITVTILGWHGNSVFPPSNEPVKNDVRKMFKVEVVSVSCQQTKSHNVDLV